MMKFNDLVARLAIELDEPIGDFAENLRVLRLAAAGPVDRRIFEWANGARFNTLFRSKHGPGGGIETNAATVGFFLTACMSEGPRREMATKALDLQFAVAATQVPVRSKRSVCPITGEHYFGGALAKVLTECALIDDLVAIRVVSKLSMAMLDFEHHGKASTSFFMSERARTREELNESLSLVMHRIAYLPVNRVRFLFDAINPSDPTTCAPARKRRELTT
jgi:hypothetical protein